MKRDDELIRELLFELEDEENWQVFVSRKLKPSPEEQKRLGHMLLLQDAGLVSHAGEGAFRLTNSGHDYLAAIRNDTIWEKTKAGADKVGGVSLSVLKDIAIAYVKKEIAERLGLDI